MKGNSWPVAVVALGFIGLVGAIFWRATATMANFTTIWTAAGPILGVVVGVIPGAVFGNQAHQAQREAQRRAEVYASHMPADAAADAERTLRTIGDR